uniref:Caenorhabditis elegans ly-6-related family-containing protein n=1 Tax=Strongyloides venezuelensis TaxID=75913 RepID=A0A0K0G568_STRVS
MISIKQINYILNIPITVTFFFKIYHVTSLKCQILDSAPKHTDDIAKFRYSTIECNELCYHKISKKVNRTLGCVTTTYAGFKNINNLTVPGYYEEHSEEHTLCFCKWNNCNAIELNFSQELNYKHNISNKIVLISTFTLTIIFMMFLKY